MELGHLAVFGRSRGVPAEVLHQPHGTDPCDRRHELRSMQLEAGLLEGTATHAASLSSIRCHIGVFAVFVVCVRLCYHLTKIDNDGQR